MQIGLLLKDSFWEHLIKRFGIPKGYIDKKKICQLKQWREAKTIVLSQKFDGLKGKTSC